MGRVSTFTALSVCAVVALLAAGLATGRPEAQAEDREYLYEGDALATALEDTEGFVPEEEEEVRERREADPQELANDDPALQLLVDGFEGAFEAQIAPKLGNQKKACGRGGRGRPPTDAGNATDTTGTGEEADLERNVRRGGGGRARRNRARNANNATDTTATGAEKLVL